MSIFCWKQKQNTIEDNFFSNKLKKTLDNRIKVCHTISVIREDILCKIGIVRFMRP